MVYAYRIYRKGNLNNPIVGGTVHADTMEQATQQAIKRSGVKAIHETRHGMEYHSFELNNEKVGIIIYANPEEF